MYNLYFCTRIESIMKVSNHITTRVSSTLYNKIDNYCLNKGLKRSAGIRTILEEYFSGVYQKDIFSEIASKNLPLDKKRQHKDFKFLLQKNTTLKAPHVFYNYTVVEKVESFNDLIYLFDKLQLEFIRIDSAITINDFDLNGCVATENFIIVKQNPKSYFVYVKNNFLDL